MRPIVIIKGLVIALFGLYLAVGLSTTPKPQVEARCGAALPIEANVERALSPIRTDCAAVP